MSHYPAISSASRRCLSLSSASARSSASTTSISRGYVRIAAIPVSWLSSSCANTSHVYASCEGDIKSVSAWCASGVESHCQYGKTRDARFVEDKGESSKWLEETDQR